MWTDGRADGHLRPTVLGRLGGVDLIKTKTKLLRRNGPDNSPEEGSESMMRFVKNIRFKSALNEGVGELWMRRVVNEQRKTM